MAHHWRNPFVHFAGFFFLGLFLLFLFAFVWWDIVWLWKLPKDLGGFSAEISLLSTGVLDENYRFEENFSSGDNDDDGLFIDMDGRSWARDENIGEWVVSQTGSVLRAVGAQSVSGFSGDIVSVSGSSSSTVLTENIAVFRPIPGSFVVWEAESVDMGHTGTLLIESGRLLFDADDMLLGGFLRFPMKTLAVPAMKNKGIQTILENHLKGKDFFDVKEHPRGRFDFVTGSVYGDGMFVSGLLDIAGETGFVDMEIGLIWSGDQLTTNGSLWIDRMAWGIDGLKGVVDDHFSVMIDLVRDEVKRS